MGRNIQTCLFFFFTPEAAFPCGDAVIRLEWKRFSPTLLSYKPSTSHLNRTNPNISSFSAQLLPPRLRIEAFPSQMLDKHWWKPYKSVASRGVKPFCFICSTPGSDAMVEEDVTVLSRRYQGLDCKWISMRTPRTYVNKRCGEARIPVQSSHQKSHFNTRSKDSFSRRNLKYFGRRKLNQSNNITFRHSRVCKSTKH